MNLKYGVTGPETRTGTETDTCTACAGTIILEFAALSRFTGDPVFEVSHFHQIIISLYVNNMSFIILLMSNVFISDWNTGDTLTILLVREPF